MSPPRDRFASRLSSNLPGAAVSSIAALAITFAFACGGSDDASVPPGSAPNGQTDGGTSTTTTTDEAGSASDASTTTPGPVDLQNRPYDVTVPSSYDKSKATPLVVLLHGFRATAAIQDDYFQLSAYAQTKGFLVALPNGTKDPQGNTFWNASDACCNFFGSKVDDVGYIGAVIADMKNKYNVDPKRVYVVGHSNGGFMANRFACERADDVAAIVSLAGAAPGNTIPCNPSSPVAMLQVHGTADETVAYAGASFYPGGPAFPGAKATVALWANKNGCANALEESGTIDLETSLDGAETKVASHMCATGAAELWTITSGKHIPKFQSDWAARFYAFLEAHPKKP